MGRFQYSEYHVGDSGMDPGMDADSLMDGLVDELLEQHSIDDAIQRLMYDGLKSDHEGEPDIEGLRDLLNRLADARRNLLEKYDMDGLRDDYQSELQNLKNNEQQELDRIQQQIHKMKN